MFFLWLLSDVWFDVHVGSELWSISSLIDIFRRGFKVEFLVLEVIRL